MRRAAVMAVAEREAVKAAVTVKAAERAEAMVVAVRAEARVVAGQFRSELGMNGRPKGACATALSTRVETSGNLSFPYRGGHRVRSRYTGVRLAI